MDILERIKSHYGSLGKIQRRIADYILEHPEEACFLSLKEFTKQAEVTEVTVLNFTKKIGLKNYLELKREMQDYIQRWLSPNKKLKQAVTSYSGESGIYSVVADNEKTALSDSYRLADVEDLKTAVRLIHSARRIYIGAHGVSRAAGMFLEQRLSFLGLDVKTINVYDTRDTATMLNSSRKDDLFILITLPNYSSEILALSSYLADTDRLFIAMTDRRASPLCAGAAVSFVCSTNDAIFYNTITALISLINLIASGCAVESGSDFVEGRERAIAIEKLLIEKNHNS